MFTRIAILTGKVVLTGLLVTSAIVCPIGFFMAGPCLTSLWSGETLES